MRFHRTRIFTNKVVLHKDYPYTVKLRLEIVAEKEAALNVLKIQEAKVKTMSKSELDNTKKERNVLYIEALRILACYLVIFNHTGGVGFSLFTQRIPGSKSFFLYLSMATFCKVAVYIFFAISGALLLAKNEPCGKTFKRAIKIVLDLLVFSFLYYVYEVYLGNQIFDIKVFVEGLFKYRWNPSFWYLYTYLGFIACLPFIRTLAQNLENKYFYCLFVFGVIFNGILPLLGYYSDIFAFTKSFNLDCILNPIVLYPCLGYFMHNRFDIVKHKFVIPFFWFMNVASILVCCYTTYYIGMKSGQQLTEANSQSCMANFAMLNCVTVFLSFKYFFCSKKIPHFVSKIIVSIGGCTYGIYIVHYWLEMKNPALLHFRWNWPFWIGINQMIASCIDCFAILLMGYIVTLIMKHVPMLRKIF